MIGAVFKPKPKSFKPKVGRVFIVADAPRRWSLRPVVTEEFQLLVEHERWKLKDQEKTWEQCR